jgi:hypothetical protein
MTINFICLRYQYRQIIIMIIALPVSTFYAQLSTPASSRINSHANRMNTAYWRGATETS